MSTERRRMVVALVYSYPATVVNDRVERAVGDPLVLLVKKSEPAWQRGKWNGPGGACEPGESWQSAASRETHEETGLEIDADEFAAVAFLSGTDFQIGVFAAELPLGSIHLSPLDEDEAAALGREFFRWHETARLPADVIPDLRWLVPLSFDDRLYPVHCDVKPICERKNVPDAPAVIGGRETDGPAEAEKFPAGTSTATLPPAAAELMAKLEAAEASSVPTGNAVARCSARAVEITRAIEAQAAKSADEVAEAIKAGAPPRK